MSISQEYKNPIVRQAADPFVYKHSDGYYYFTSSVPEYDRIEIRRAKTIEELGSISPIVVWRKHVDGEMSAYIWAPEIHFIDDKWYIYFAAAKANDPKGDMFDHRIYVLENLSLNPLEGPWLEKGQLKTNYESFALDATSFQHKGIRYLVWPQNDPNIKGNSNLYIAKLSNPWTISGKQVMISKPEYPWECIGFSVNEGPAVLKKNGKIFISYSASATDYNYCMGLLTADDTNDLLNPLSWSKSSVPVFTTSYENNQYGPGHNSFTVSEDNQTDVMIYHARNYKEIDGNSLDDPNRHARAQKLTWNDDGTPDFGRPVADLN
ncbi:family 43 glycosylhydrolase [Clostridium estertheticum]|uniref:Family 43 glycosylhydrolase n=1 Tax=Clostridium estertheticum TaxID=238834 RepID=A0AA47EHW7_9CLOT|nr:family 43 glycosylhydrolase [Clostridium estertheticum]MBU3155440.1 family 43 glycosylhydrolase [Clostridium estertheticum]MBU3199524.1 family 43 glycosylhydrolase [Clostridium estertheticum]WAG60511.1 family 43 glycosylhydrolase [Clostridium estertheticum]WAG65398.1 family 43 glycosylhydrolase [Clostridium estertheticum]